MTIRLAKEATDIAAMAVISSVSREDVITISSFVSTATTGWL